MVIVFDIDETTERKVNSERAKARNPHAYKRVRYVAADLQPYVRLTRVDKHGAVLSKFWGGVTADGKPKYKTPLEAVNAQIAENQRTGKGPTHIPRWAKHVTEQVSDINFKKVRKNKKNSN